MPSPRAEAKRFARTRTLRERLGALGQLPPFFRAIWKTGRVRLIVNVLLRLVRSVLPVAMLYVAKLVIDEVIGLARLRGHPVGLEQWQASGLLTRLELLLALEFTLAIVSDMVGRNVTVVEAMIAERFTIAVSIQLMEHVASLDLEDLENSDTQDSLDRARAQAIGRNGGVVTLVLGQLQDIATVVSFAAGLLVYAPWLMAFLAIALVPAFAGEAHFNALVYALDFSRTMRRRLMDYLVQIGASVESAKELKIFGLHRFLTQRYRTVADEFYRENVRLAIRRAAYGTLLAGIGTSAYYAAYSYIAWGALRGAFTIGDFTFLAGSFLRLRTLIEGLLLGFSRLAGQALYIQDLFTFLAHRPSIMSRPHALAVPRVMQQGFSFENVGFRYGDSERWAVRHLTFTLRAGEVLALVGENGAGKTTLVKLLARLYEPEEGRILLDGRDLRDYDLAALRANVGVIFQDFMRYHFTAAENIAVGRIEEIDDRRRIIAAAERSLADEPIRRLPFQYDQPIGKRFDDGVDLSGGEWQKIALARAYMRDAQLLILDEPTAALDARAEFEVFRRFKDLTVGRTAVLISHRFSSVRMADRILVLAGGRVEAVGTHDQLIRQNGRYAELFELQAAGYR